MLLRTSNKRLGSAWTDFRDSVTGTLSDQITDALTSSNTSSAPAPVTVTTSSKLSNMAVPLGLAALFGLAAWKFLR